MVDELGNTTADPLLLGKDCSGTGQISKKELSVDAPEITERIPTEFSKLEEFDIKNIENPQYVAHYAPEIFEYMHQIEVN